MERTGRLNRLAGLRGWVLTLLVLFLLVVENGYGQLEKGEHGDENELTAAAAAAENGVLGEKTGSGGAVNDFGGESDDDDDEDDDDAFAAIGASDSLGDSNDPERKSSAEIPKRHPKVFTSYVVFDEKLDEAEEGQEKEEKPEREVAEKTEEELDGTKIKRIKIGKATYVLCGVSNQASKSIKITGIQVEAIPLMDLVPYKIPEQPLDLIIETGKEHSFTHALMLPENRERMQSQVSLTILYSDGKSNYSDTLFNETLEFVSIEANQNINLFIITLLVTMSLLGISFRLLD